MSVQSKMKERFAKYQRADDLGISSKVEGSYKRTLNKNGTFNINRIGGQINRYSLGSFYLTYVLGLFN